MPELLKTSEEIYPEKLVELQKLTDEELVEYYLNARKTFCLAGGHTKAYWNKTLCGWYADILERRCVLHKYFDRMTAVKPDGNHPEGVFNGVGST